VKWFNFSLRESIWSLMVVSFCKLPFSVATMISFSITLKRELVSKILLKALSLLLLEANQMPTVILLISFRPHAMVTSMCSKLFLKTVPTSSTLATFA